MSDIWWNFIVLAFMKWAYTTNISSENKYAIPSNITSILRLHVGQIMEKR